MKKKQLKYLAVTGILSGILTTSSYAVNSSDSSLKDIDLNSDKSIDDDSLTEKELLEELNDDGKKLYRSLGIHEKELALKVANQACQGFNECAKLNACRTAKNNCSGQGSCKGQSKCSFIDKNLAVKVVYNKTMAEKRNKIAN